MEGGREREKGCEREREREREGMMLSKCVREHREYKRRRKRKD